MIRNKVALITGIHGMVGSHLADLLLTKGYEVWGLERRSTSKVRDNTKHLVGKVNFITGDLADQNSLLRALKICSPNEVYNCAAQSAVWESWNTPEQTADITGLGVLRVLEAIREYGKEVKFLQMSSSEMWGKLTVHKADENTPHYPRSPYGVSKCVSPRTKIYTKNGLVTANKIKVGDRVWTHTGQLQKVTKVFKRHYNGRFINIRVSSSTGMSGKKFNLVQTNFQITLTPEHPVLTTRGWVVACDLTKNDCVKVIASKCKWCDKRIPANRVFCCQSCHFKYHWKYDQEYRRSIVSRVQKRFKENDYLHTPQAVASYRKSMAERLRNQGMNYMEYYIDSLLQRVVPGFFKFVGDGKECIEGYFPDWINKDKKAIIEYVGYGQTCERRMSQFKKKLSAYKRAGWQVLTIYGSEFNKPKLIEEKVSQFVSDLGSLEFIDIPIISIENYTKRNNNFVYNFEVENDNSFIANGIVLHNCFAHFIQRNYRESYGMFACSAICCNTESNRRGLDFVTRKITWGVAKIYCRLDDKIVLGNLQARRDWSYCPDVCQGIYKIMQHYQPDDFVLATGKAYTVEYFVRKAFECIGIKNWEDYIKQDERFMRPADIDYLCGDASKAYRVLGWEPKKSLDEIIELMVKNDIRLLKK